MLQPQTTCETRNRPILIGLSAHFRKVLVFQPACKQWTCPACAETNRKRWAVRAFHGYEQLSADGLTPRFLTLTSHEKLTPEQALWVWPKAWSVLGQRARRGAERFEYLLVPEQHKSGKIHIHAIETSSLGNRWWKNNARACGLGYIASEEDIRSPEQAAWYVSKYISKQLTVLQWPKGFRRVRTSQHWPKLEELPDNPNWTFSPIKAGEELGERVLRLEAQGYEILYLDHAAAWVYIDASANDGELTIPTQ